MSRWLALTVLAFLVLVGTIGYVNLRRAYPNPAINPGNYRQIFRGMTLTEVESLLGGPAGDYTTGPRLDQQWRDEGTVRKGQVAKYWAADTLTIVVWFDARGMVVDHLSVNYRRDRDSWAERFYRWLGRQ